MNRREYLQSFLKQNQRRLPRKLKKQYLKQYRGSGGPVLVQTFTQFCNLYRKYDREDRTLFGGLKD